MSERLSIKNMATEPGSKDERLFYPDRDITKEDWSAVQGWLDKYIKNASTFSEKLDCADMIVYSRLLGKELKIGRKDGEKIEQCLKDKVSTYGEFDEDIGLANGYDGLEEAFLLQRLGAGHNLGYDDFSAAEQEAREAGILSFFRFAAFASDFNHRPVISEEDWDIANHILEDFRSSESSLEPFIHLAAYMAILGRKPELSEDDWRRLSGLLARTRPQHSPDFVRFAVYMNILAADTIGEDIERDAWKGQGRPNKKVDLDSSAPPIQRNF